jgi:hypothetical protein
MTFQSQKQKCPDNNKNMSWTDSEDEDDEEPSTVEVENDKNDLVFLYLAKLMECHHASPGELPLEPLTGSHAEFFKRQPIVLEQVKEILTGSDHFKKFRQTIDSADVKCRVDIVDAIARQLKFVGMLMRVMYCVEVLSKSPMDPSVCCQVCMCIYSVLPNV